MQSAPCQKRRFKFLRTFEFVLLYRCSLHFLNDKSMQEMIRLEVMLIYCSVRIGLSDF